MTALPQRPSHSLLQQVLLMCAAVIATTFAIAPAAFAQHSDGGHQHISNHAPIGVMGDHLHAQGEWMLSYRFMSMRMEDNLRGSQSISPESIASAGLNLRVVPVEMKTDMHMFGAMYAPSDKLTLMLMLNYLQKEMDHITFQGPCRHGNRLRRVHHRNDSGYWRYQTRCAVWHLCRRQTWQCCI